MKGSIQTTLSWCSLVVGWLIFWVFMAFPVWVMVAVLSVPLLLLALALGFAGLAGLRNLFDRFWVFAAVQLVAGWVIGIVLGQIFTPDFRWIN